MPHLQTKKIFLTDRRTMERRRVDGLKKSDYKPEDKSLRRHFAKHVCYSRTELPPKVDLRPWMTSVKDQGKLGSCTAHAIASFVEYIINKTTHKPDDVSRLFLYYNSRKEDLKNEQKKEGIKNRKHTALIVDAGCPIVSAIEALKKKGFCFEFEWPYKKKQVNIKPPKGCYRSANEKDKLQALKVNADIDEMRSCLAQGLPIIFGLDMYPSFGKAAKNGGAVPMPNLTKKPEYSHAMLAVGYSNYSQAFIVRNSWGSDWGDQGYCYIPFEYMMNKNLCTFLYTLKLTEKYELGKEQWVRQDNDNYLARGYNDLSDDGDYFIEERTVEQEGVLINLHIGHDGGHHGDRNDSDDGRHGRGHPSGHSRDDGNSDDERHGRGHPSDHSGDDHNSDDERHGSHHHENDSGDDHNSDDERHGSHHHENDSGDDHNSDDERHGSHHHENDSGDDHNSDD
ncbi:unnamed protein product [Rotaria magnacalcarata]|uniref:Peptidase C1A papain C-terminal domain-containing protein n=5 Tax=Rotaria magnacalcarata TaxID=392030 RepID=A0A816LDG5_9BILA|nr:unnamed protein product [Rotaria magnacalcarata]CAF4036549.1 unnamed protein product [Rotaria magnacalcarata]